MSKLVIWVLVLAGASISYAGSNDPAPTADQLATLAQKVVATNDAIHTLRVKGFVWPGDQPVWEAELLLQKPDHCALLVRDAVDGAPIMLVVDGQGLLYNPVHGDLEQFDAWGALSLSGEGNQLSFDFEVNEKATAPLLKSISFDFRFFVEAMSTKRHATQNGVHGFILRGDDKEGNFIDATIDPTQPFPYLRLDVVQKNQPHPAISLEEFLVNSPLTGNEFTFPNIAALGTHLPVRRIELPKMYLDGLAETLMFRQAIRHPGLRPGLPKRLWISDWDAAKTSDVELVRAIWPEIRRVTGNMLTSPLPVEAAGVIKKPATQPTIAADLEHENDLSLFRDAEYKYSRQMDVTLALRLLKWADAHPDDPEGMYAAAYAINDIPKSLPAEQHRVPDFLRRVCTMDYAPGFSELANVTFEGRLVDKDPKEAARLLRVGIDRNEPFACYYMGLRMEDGDGVPKDVQGALFMYEKAIDGGCTRAYFDLAALYAALGNQDAYIRALEAGTIAGDLNSIYRFGLYKYQSQVPPDPIAASRMMQHAARNNVVRAQYWLGVFYKDGVGMPADPKQAAMWLAKSLDGGYPYAAVPLAAAYLSGQGVHQDRQHAIQLLIIADQAGVGQASYQLAMLYLNDSKSPEETEQAKQLLQRAVMRGVMEADTPLRKLQQ